MKCTLGIALVYCAILAPGPLHAGASLLMASGFSIVVLGLWARHSDELKWFNLFGIDSPPLAA